MDKHTKKHKLIPFWWTFCLVITSGSLGTFSRRRIVVSCTNSLFQYEIFNLNARLGQKHNSMIFLKGFLSPELISTALFSHSNVNTSDVSKYHLWPESVLIFQSMRKSVLKRIINCLNMLSIKSLQVSKTRVPVA